MSTVWRSGNAFALLENGEAFFPRVFEAIRQARQEVLLETFIVFEDKVGLALRDALICAARRGARVEVMVDGYGSDELSAGYVEALAQAGVRLRVFDPRARLFGMRTNLFRRMHRKLAVIDGEIAFVGGINFSADHLADYGPQAKQDYAVELRGPIVQDIRRFMADAISPGPRRGRRRWGRRAWAPPRRESGEAAFVTRDNDRCRTDIERHYRAALRLARHDVLLANAYFFPGYRLLRELRGAARRGVRVRLILQGEPDMPLARLAGTMLYEYLMSAGVEIHEYCERPLHGKVAAVDDLWSTVGSSNLEPLSLALNLEANVMIRDRAFNASLRESLERLVRSHCRAVERAPRPRRRIHRALFGVFIYHFLRRFPAWAGWLPAHRPRLRALAPPQPPQAQDEAGPGPEGGGGAGVPRGDGVPQ